MEHNKIDTLGGFIMFATMIAAIILANFSTWYYDFINFKAYTFNITMPLKSLVKDILMVLFFVYIGIELRLEFYKGYLANKKHCILPLMAAMGGMLIPSIIYLVINFKHHQNYAGFAIPCATDIAFAICLFNLFGKKFPSYMRIFLLSIAIFDDLGAILIIALFYTKQFSLWWFLLSIPVVGFLGVFNRLKFANTLGYILLGVLLGVSFYKAGLHTTLAGFLLGFALPVTRRNKTQYSKEIMKNLHPFVQFIVLPIFAFVSSGVTFSSNCLLNLFDPIVLGISFGLFFGKQIGITLFTFITVRCKWEKLPPHINIGHIYLVSIFAGIGFTMSLFIGQLAFKGEYLQDLVKTGVIVGLLGCTILVSFVNIIQKYCLKKLIQ